MELSKGLLIVLIIILIMVIIKQKCNAKRGKSQSRTWDCVDRANGNVTSVRLQQQKACAPEKRAQMENAEYFTECASNQAQMSVDLLGNSCGCDPNGNFSYATNEFGAKGMTYKDWVTSQAVDPQVISNHAEFVRDRSQGGPQNITGKTYSPDSNSSYDPISWMGIRGRPQAVSVCSPDQVSDMDYDLFPKNQKVIWRTNEEQ